MDEAVFMDARPNRGAKGNGNYEEESWQEDREEDGQAVPEGQNRQEDRPQDGQAVAQGQDGEEGQEVIPVLPDEYNEKGRSAPRQAGLVFFPCRLRINK